MSKKCKSVVGVTHFETHSKIPFSTFVLIYCENSVKIQKQTNKYKTPTEISLCGSKRTVEKGTQSKTAKTSARKRWRVPYVPVPRVSVQGVNRATRRDPVDRPSFDYTTRYPGTERPTHGRRTRSPKPGIIEFRPDDEPFGETDLSSMSSTILPYWMCSKPESDCMGLHTPFPLSVAFLSSGPGPGPGPFPHTLDLTDTIGYYVPCQRKNQCVFFVLFTPR